MSKRTKFTPKVGQIYRNQGGETFRCLAVVGSDDEHNVIMQNTKSLWTFQANGCAIFEDGTIDWDYSTEGHFGNEDESGRSINMQTETLLDQLKNQCLTQAIDILSGEHCPNVACVEIAERLANIVVAIDRHNLQAQGVEGINRDFEILKNAEKQVIKASDSSQGKDVFVSQKEKEKLQEDQL